MVLPENGQTDEANILARLASDPQAFGDLFEAFFPRVYNYFRYRTAERGLADDLTAMTFEQAWLGLRKFHPDRGSFEIWLITIARNLMNEQLRFQELHPQTSLGPLSDQPGKGASAEPAVTKEDDKAELLETVAKLNERQRDLIALKFAARISNHQIAALYGVSESDLSVMLYGALERLRGETENDEQPGEGLVNERGWPERIDFDFKALLNGTGLPEGEGSPQAVRGHLEVARRLARMDFSPDSQIRQILSERLAAHPPLRRWSWHSPGGLARLLSPPQLVALLIIVLLLIIMLVFALNN